MTMMIIIFALELGWPDLLGVDLRWDCMDTCKGRGPDDRTNRSASV